MLQAQSQSMQQRRCNQSQLNVQSSKPNPISHPLIVLPTISQVDVEHFLMHELRLTISPILHPLERIKINSASTSFLFISCTKVKCGAHWPCICEKV